MWDGQYWKELQNGLCSSSVGKLWREEVSEKQSKAASNTNIVKLVSNLSFASQKANNWNSQKVKPFCCLSFMNPLRYWSFSWNSTVCYFLLTLYGWKHWSSGCNCTACFWSAPAGEVMDIKTLPAPVSWPCSCAVNRLMRDVNKVTSAHWKDKSTER